MSLMGALAVGVAKGTLIRIKVVLDLTRKIRREREGGQRKGKKKDRRVCGWEGSRVT